MTVNLETINDLKQWITTVLPQAETKLDSNGEVIIKTKLTVEMNGTLYPLAWDSE